MKMTRRSGPAFALASALVYTLVLGHTLALPVAAETLPGSINALAPLHDQSYQARDIVEAHPKSYIANANFAAVQLALGDREYAHGFFSKAIALNRKDFIAQLGLAECVANDPARGAHRALVVLAEAERACPPRNESEWLLLANAYAAMSAPDRAFSIYKRIYQEAASKNNALLLESLLLSALESKNDKTAAQYFPALKGPVNNSNLLVALARRRAQLALAGVNAARLKTFVYDQARSQFAQDGDLFYKVGRAYDSSEPGQSDKAAARQFYEEALRIYPQEGKFALALARRMSLDGQPTAARALLLKVRQKGEELEPTMRRTLVKGSIEAGIAMLKKPQRYNSSVVKLTHLSCLCKVAAINYILRRQPGVVFARVPEGSGPDNLIVYDPRLTTAEKVWNKMGAEARYKLLPQKSGVVDSFAALVRLVADNYDNEGVSQKPFYHFERLPLRPLESGA